VSWCTLWHAPASLAVQPTTNCTMLTSLQPFKMAISLRKSAMASCKAGAGLAPRVHSHWGGRSIGSRLATAAVARNVGAGYSTAQHSTGQCITALHMAGAPPPHLPPLPCNGQDLDSHRLHAVPQRLVDLQQQRQRWGVAIVWCRLCAFWPKAATRPSAAAGNACSRLCCQPTHLAETAAAQAPVTAVWPLQNLDFCKQHAEDFKLGAWAAFQAAAVGHRPCRHASMKGITRPQASNNPQPALFA
jgi:hypothetical protein